MAPSSSFPRLSRISILFLASAVAAQASHIFHRQAPVCGGKSNLKQCGSDFPSEFCCPADTACLTLNSPTVKSVICCPNNSDCGIIQPITCDITQLNATLHPDNQMHLSQTSGMTLPTCGDKCCPMGYSCKSGMCFKDTTSPSPSPTSTRPSPSATKPAAASQTSACAAAPVQSQSGFDGRSFAAGFFPGIVIGALSCIGLMWVIKKRRETQAKERYSGDFGHVSRQISDPIYDPSQHTARTDFMRRGSHSVQPSPNSATDLVYNDKSTEQPVHGLTPRIKSMWDRTPKLNFGFTSGLPSNPAPPPPVVRAGNNNHDPYTTPRHTPRRKHRSHRSTRSQRPEPARTGSTETIDVLMPAPSFLGIPQAPAMRDNRLTTDTTFTKLMERAGFDDEGRRDVRNHSSPHGRMI
jgi:hypothetical protein